mgnify:FL=1
MNLYCITEKQNINSVRDGYRLECESLLQAKKEATKRQIFQDTVLTIEYLGQVLSVKTGKKWADVD